MFEALWNMKPMLLGAESALRMSTSHFMMDWKVVS